MKTIENVDVKDKRVLVRADLNIAVDGRMDNTGVLKQAAKTINHLRNHGAKVILVSELGELEKEGIPHYRIEKLVGELEKVLETHVYDVEDITEDNAQETVSQMTSGEVVLLENLDFYKEEYLNDEGFAQSLSRLADIYVDDDFRVSNQEYASNVGITKYLPSYAGLSLKWELDKVSDFINNVYSPFVMLIGGAEPDKKMPIIERFLPIADTIMVAGEVALAFLKAQGHEIGGYTLPNSVISMAEDILEQAKEEKAQIICPVDFLVAKQIVSGTERQEVGLNELTGDWFVVDIGPRTFKEFNQKIYDAEFVFWNGPVGIYEIPDFEYGTRAIAQSIASTSGKTLAGGTDTVDVINKYDKAQYIDVVSYGGDSLLSYLKGEELPGIEALD